MLQSVDVHDAKATHLSKAAAHEAAAKMHDRAIAQNRGNIVEHLDASARHRAAAENEYRAANEELSSQVAPPPL